MGLSLYEVSIPPIILHLKTLSALLKKGQGHVGPANEAKLIDSRLISDMGDLVFQIQRVSDASKSLAVRVGHTENVSMPDNEKTIPELLERIQKTIEYLEKVDPKCMDGMEETEVVIRTGPVERKLTGKVYVLYWALPNFYFHYVTAYALLRKEGVPVGKADYLGNIWT